MTSHGVLFAYLIRKSQEETLGKSNFVGANQVTRPVAKGGAWMALRRGIKNKKYFENE